jgi:hypothetical protein
MVEDIPMPPEAARPAPDRWSPVTRAVASAGIVLYLACVIMPPLAGPPPASGLAVAALQPLRPLVGALSLGHGYRFFAPDPGPGHSIRWSMEFADGSTRKGIIPDRDTDRPRLLYHRRFMISEKIAALVPPDGVPEEARRQSRGDWQPLVKDVAGHLLERHGGDRVTLELVEHYLPAPEEVMRAEAGADAVTPLGTYALTEEGLP